MNFVKFIENRYQELTLQNSKPDAYNVKIDSEINATYSLLSGYRWAVKWLLVPKVLFDFLMVKIGMKAEPEPVLLNQAKKAAEEQKAKADAEAAGKITTVKKEKAKEAKGEAPIG